GGAVRGGGGGGVGPPPLSRACLGGQFLEDAGRLPAAHVEDQQGREDRAGDGDVQDPAVVGVVGGPGEQPADQQAGPDDGAQVADAVGPPGTHRPDPGRVGGRGVVVGGEQPDPDRRGGDAD